MRGSYCITFIEHISEKPLLYYTNLFSANIIYKYFKDKYNRRKYKPRLWTKRERDKTRNVFLEQIGKRYLMRKKTQKNLHAFKLH